MELEAANSMKRMASNAFWCGFFFAVGFQLGLAVMFMKVLGG